MPEDFLYSILDKRISNKNKSCQTLPSEKCELAKLKIGLKNLPGTVVLTNLSGIIKYVNHKYLRSTGFSEGELLGKSITSFWEHPQTLSDIIKSLENAGEWEGHIFHKTKNGIIYHKLASISKLSMNNGLKAYLLIIGHPLEAVDNVSATKTRNAENEKSYHAILNTAPYSITLTRISDQRYIYVNKAFCQLSGYSKEEAIGQTSLELNLFVNLADRERILELLRTQNRVDGCEVAFRRKDGSITYTLISASAILFRGELCVLYITSNIDALKDSQKALKESEKRFRTIFESAQDAIFIKDTNLKYTLVNPAMERLHGIKASHFLGKTDKQLFNTHEATNTEAAEKRVLQGEIVEEEIQPVKSSDKFFHSIKVPLTGTTSQITGICGFLRDLTSVKRLEAQLLQSQKMEAIGTLAGGIAHDFNNLLHVILAYSQMMLYSDTIDDTNRVKLREIEKSGLRASELTSQLLTFSRKVKLDPRPVDLNQLIKQVEKLLKRTIPKMINIELHLSDSILPVNADAGQIEQMLLNIGINARDAMPDGGRLIFETANVVPDLHLQKHSDKSSIEYVLLSIKDTGQGMTKKVLDHMFEPFYTTKESGKGTGLGLATVYGIIKNHDGHIFCESEPGKGTTFKILLPAIESKVIEDIEDHPEPFQQGHGETILFIDDEATLRTLADEFLCSNGYTVVTAGSGEAGISIYREKMSIIAIIVLDLIMPGMGGKHCLQELLEMNPQAKVIISSGYSSKNHFADNLLKQATAFIQKPYKFSELLELINNEVSK